MSLKIALIVSVILQFITAFLAMTLIKRTKTNIAWWLISFGFLLMAIRRLFDLFDVYDSRIAGGLFNIWIGVLISIVMLLSLSFIKRIFNIQKRYEELKKMNEARVFSAIIKTEEDLKQKFSKELHDGLGPLLSSVKMAVSAIIKDPKSEQNIKILKNTDNLINESINTVKEISNDLSPHVLNNFGLEKAIKSHIKKFEVYEGPKIVFKSNLDNKRYPYTIETVVYRIICELITNTLKHAEANNIFLDILAENELLKIKYMDDGKGFEFTNSYNELSGLGLTNIQSRIKSVHGKCDIHSAPDEGFNINILINTNLYDKTLDNIS